jgi:hypothetical protein
MSFNFIGIQREMSDHEKSVEGRVTAVRIDRRSEKSEDRGRNRLRLRLGRRPYIAWVWSGP